MGEVSTRQHVATLRDGTRVLLRPIQPDDAWRLSEGLARLSPRSRYLRFHRDLDAPGFGVARYVRLADEPTVAEAAVTVLDDVLAEQEDVLEVFDQLGTQRKEVEPGVVQLDLALPDDPALLPVPGMRELFREVARGLLPPVLWRLVWPDELSGTAPRRVRRTPS